MDDFDALVHMSKYAGERFDLVQAGGGNSSVKQSNGIMLIKASGVALSEVERERGYSKVVTKEVASITTNSDINQITDKKDRETLTSKLMKSATIDMKNRPSIETLLHSILYKYTLHTHPLIVNIAVIQKDCKKIIGEIFSDKNVLLVGYQTPGIELALALQKEIGSKSQIPQVIFLQNHGLIISSDDFSEIKKLTEEIISRLEKYFNKSLHHYKLTSEVSNLINRNGGADMVSYLCEDLVIKSLVNDMSNFTSTPFCPDSFVYCGANMLAINSLNDSRSIREFIAQYHELPKVVLFESNVFFIAQTVKKAKDVEELFKFHLIVLSNSQTDINYLSEDEMAYLGNWEAEKFRVKT